MEDQDDSRGLACPYRPSQSGTTSEQPKHPLIAFKHFVDDQFRAITQLTSFSDLKQKMQVAGEVQAQHERDAHFRWTGRDASPDHDEMVVQRMTDKEKHDAFDAAMMLVRESSKRNNNVDPAKVEALYNDNEFLAFEHDRFAGPLLSFGGACYYMPETGDNLPSTASLFGRWPLPAPKFLSIDWFKNSIYSPINIETNPSYDPNRQLTWRFAFEDLLNTTLSRPSETLPWEGVRPNYPDTRQWVYLGPGVDWLLSLYCRGVLPLSPSLQALKGRNNFGILEKTRQQWTSLAGSWAPNTAEKEFAELVRAVASPPAPQFTNVKMRDQKTGLDAHVEASPSLGAAEFFEDIRWAGNQFSSPEAREFWRAIYSEDADKAARLIVAWEGKGRLVEELIDDCYIVDDYLSMETHPALWPLCEALEKSHSELLFEQAACMLERKRLEDQYLPSFEKEAREEEPKKRFEAQQIESTSQTPTQDSIGILAALTTTHTTRLPDGSVTTKVVLKKRFADGREETTESVKVEYPEQQATPATTDDSPNKKRGWFWS